MAGEQTDIVADLDDFAESRTGGRRWANWSEEKKDLIRAIVRHNQDPSKTQITAGGAEEYLRSKGHRASSIGIKSFVKSDMGIEWGAW